MAFVRRDTSQPMTNSNSTTRYILKIIENMFQKYENSNKKPLIQKRQKNQRSVANICWIIEKAREFQKNFCFIDYTKRFDGGSQ